MAGAYPNAPSRRMAWDTDGSVLLTATEVGFSAAAGTAPANPYTIIALADAEDMNDEDNLTLFINTNNNANDGFWVTLLFPEKRELDGMFLAARLTGGEDITNEAYSLDSTNGMDGIWTDLTHSWITTVPAADDYRDMIVSYAVSNVVSLMFTLGADDSQQYRYVHLYGTITPGDTPDRLLFLDPDDFDTAFSLPLDFGDVPRGQTQTDTFKVKNNSGSLTANTIQITAEDLFDGSNSWYTYSDDDITYSATLAAGNLSPGGTILVYLKQIVPDAQVPGVYAARTKVSAASWS